MRLTWRDGVATALGLLGAEVVVAVLQGWDWLLLDTTLQVSWRWRRLASRCASLAPTRSGTVSRSGTHG